MESSLGPSRESRLLSVPYERDGKGKKPQKQRHRCHRAQSRCSIFFNKLYLERTLNLQRGHKGGRESSPASQMINFLGFHSTCVKTKTNISWLLLTKLQLSFWFHYFFQCLFLYSRIRSRTPQCTWASCLLRLLWSVTVSQTLFFTTLTVFRRPGQIPCGVAFSSGLSDVSRLIRLGWWVWEGNKIPQGEAPSWSCDIRAHSINVAYP